MAKQLITQKRFLPYFCTQFMGVFNDSLYRLAFNVFIAYFLVKENDEMIISIALIVFVLPFFLFGAIAGQLADKHEKSYLIRRIKIAEMIVMLLGAVALYFQSVVGMLIVIFALGTQSAFFGPIKYSILPQHLSEDEILTGNAYVEASTFLAILLGTIIGGLLVEELATHGLLMTLIISVAVIGWVSSCFIPQAKPEMPEMKVNFNIFTSTAAIVKKTKSNKAVFLTILAISWFWFYGAVIQTQFLEFSTEVIGGSNEVAITLLAFFSIGIAVGSFACSLLSHGKVEIGVMPFGAIGMTIFAWLLADISLPPTDELRTVREVFEFSQAWWASFYIFMIAFFCGIYIVPLYAFLQIRSDPKHRSRTIAVNNIINGLFMVVAGVMSFALFAIGFDVSDLYRIVAVLNIIVTLYILFIVPEFFLRLLSWLLVHSVYKIRKQELHHIPEKGPAIIVCNHISFFDPPVLLAVINRPARFVMWHGFYEIPIVRLIFKGVKAIPIGTRKERPDLIDQAFESIAEALKEDELVVIFPEGKITRDGEINEFQAGIDKILAQTPVPVVPMAIRGMWGTWWSRHKGRAMKGLPRSFMKKLTVVAGPAIAPEYANRALLEEKVIELRGDEK